MRRSLAPNLSLLLALTAGCAHDFVVTTEPKGAVITADAKVIGHSPLVLDDELRRRLAKDGLLRFNVERAGYHTFSIIMPVNPDNDSIGITLRPDLAQSQAFAQAGAPAESDGSDTKAPTLPLSRASIEYDLANLLRRQGKLMGGEKVSPLKLSDWRATYPDSGAAPFLEGLRAYQEGRKGDALQFFNEASRRDDWDADYQTVAAGAAKAGGG